MRSVRHGLGAYDPSVLLASAPTRGERIAEELRRLERARTSVLLDALEPMAGGERLLDVGLPRDSVDVLRQRFRCAVVDGGRDWTSFPDGHFDAVVHEGLPRATDLFERFGELARILRSRGRCVLTAWCVNDHVPEDDNDIRRLHDDVGLSAHPRARLFAALTSNGFVPYVISDLTTQAVPYWKLRLHADSQTGVEGAFLAAYLSHKASLLLVVAERFSAPRRTQPRRTQPRRTAKPRTVGTRRLSAVPPRSPDDTTTFGLGYR